MVGWTLWVTAAAANSGDEVWVPQLPCFTELWAMTIVIEPTPHIASRLGDFMLLLVTLLFYASLLSLALIPIILSYDETGGTP